MSVMMELRVHPGDDYLASVEAESLQVLTYARLCDIPTSKYSIEPSYVSNWLSIAVHQPTLKEGEDQPLVQGAHNIINHLKEHGYMINPKLDDAQQNEEVLYSSMMTDRLFPAILYLRWLDSQNFVEVTRRWYARSLYFPSSLFFPSWRHGAVKRSLSGDLPEEYTCEQKGAELVKRAEECISFLSNRLGDKEYFFGNRPSMLDAMAYGCLEVVLQWQLTSNNSLQRLVHSTRNLRTFCERVRKQCYPKMKTRSMESTATQSSGASSKLAFWGFLAVAVALLGLQGARVGLFSQVARGLKGSGS